MKFKEKLIVLISILGITLFANAQAGININNNPFWEGQIKMVDGTIKTGLIQVPHTVSQNKVSIKSSEKAKVEKIKRKEVESISLVSPTGKDYLFDCLPLTNTIKGNSSIGRNLILAIGKNNYVTFYYAVNGLYKVDKEKGTIFTVFKYLQGKDFPTTTYFIRKRGSEKANLIAMTSNIAGFKKGVLHHLTEDQALHDRINNEELKFKDMPEIIDTYLKATREL